MRRVPVAIDRAARTVCLNHAGQTHTFRIPSRSELWAPGDREGHGVAGATVAPFPAIVTETLVRPGDEVRGGDVVIVIEAMKMLHSLTASGPGRVAEVRVSTGDSVESGQVLITYEAEAPPEAKTEQGREEG
jgi:3-methylcrotonyl-CoA carboxylase alpha subunit